jgi:hypothetical protein
VVEDVFKKYKGGVTVNKPVVLALAVILAASTAAVAGVHTVGGGTPNSNNTFPFAGGSTYPAFRWQTMWFQSELGEAGQILKIEWQVYSGGSSSPGGTFNNCDILLCHTNISAVTTTFASNYGTGTPVNVFTGTYVLPPSNALDWITIVEPANFTYNNTDNLLIEVSWQTSPSGSKTFFAVRSSGSNFPGRVYSYSSKTATTGTLGANYHHYGRITIGYVGVAPTSLGRIKSLYN